MKRIVGLSLAGLALLVSCRVEPKPKKEDAPVKLMEKSVATIETATFALG